MIQWTTIPAAAKESGIPDRTLRRYVDRHGLYIPSRRDGRTILISRESFEVIRFIRDRYSGGDMAEQVEEALADRFNRTLTVTEDEPDSRSLTTFEAVGKLAEEVRALRDQLAKRDAEVAVALERIEKLEAERDQRDRELLEELRKPWWQRLFGSK
jgi:DNA-binding transcriptional MerR regulator